LNLQPVSNKTESDDQEGWRNSHIIRFSQIDGAGIVYYPRYFEMLADSFPQQFAVSRPAQFEISFHNPVRLGERLQLEAATGPGSTEFSVTGRSGDQICFELRKSELESVISPGWLVNNVAFTRQAEIQHWMTGANGRMHLGRCYELTAVLMEEWFSASLQCPFATLQSADGALVPTVKLQTEVQDLPVNGDRVQISLVVLHVGRSSLGLGMTVSRDGELLVQTRQTIVFVAYQNDRLSPVPIPAHLLPTLQSQRVVAST
jgi:4-hydroxybenzoyl-CoA thioesterase